MAENNDVEEALRLLEDPPPFVQTWRRRAAIYDFPYVDAYGNWTSSDWPKLPQELAVQLLEDSDVGVAQQAARRIDDVQVLTERTFDPRLASPVVAHLARGALALGASDLLWDKAVEHRKVPPVVAEIVARESADLRFLRWAAGSPRLHYRLVSNPHVNADTLREIVGPVPPGRPPGDAQAWSQALRAAAERLAGMRFSGAGGAGDIAEMSGCAQAAGDLFRQMAPLCAAAADALEQDAQPPPSAGPPPGWAEQLLTWALELTRTDQTLSVFVRLGTSFSALGDGVDPQTPEPVLHAAAAELARLGRDQDPVLARLATAGAALLTALANLPGSLAWMRAYGPGDYAHLDAAAILALRAADPVLAEVGVIEVERPDESGQR